MRLGLLPSLARRPLILLVSLLAFRFQGGAITTPNQPGQAGLVLPATRSLGSFGQRNPPPRALAIASALKCHTPRLPCRGAGRTRPFPRLRVSPCLNSALSPYALPPRNHCSGFCPRTFPPNIVPSSLLSSFPTRHPLPKKGYLATLGDLSPTPPPGQGLAKARLR